MTISCEICGHERNLKPIAQLIDDYVVLRCSGCGIKNIYPIPTDQQLVEYYSQYYLTKDDYGKAEDLIQRQEPIYNYLARKIGKRESLAILDYGFGAGYFIKFASKKNSSVSGFDLSEQNRQQITDYNKRNNVNINLLDVNSSEFKKNKPGFDVITMFQVIEHLNYPRKTLKHISSFINEGGYLYLECPNNDAIINKLKNIFNKVTGRKKFYDSMKPPEHIYGYNKKSMAMFFNSLGFEIVDIGDYYLSDGIHQVEGYYWWPPLFKNKKFYHPIWFAKSMMQLADMIMSKLFGRGSGLYMLAKKVS